MKGNIPRHLAIVMDGNGRWAEKRGRPRLYGHIRGTSMVREVVREAGERGISALTLFGFSTENWSRPEAEKALLWKLFKKTLRKEIKELNRENVKIKIIGQLDRLDSELQDLIKTAEAELSHNTGMKLTLCISYGSRAEIVSVVQEMMKNCRDGIIQPEEVTEDLIEEYLWTRHLGPLSEVDLVIRTSGESRVSNFLLWQSAYAEYLFVDTFWPDFDKYELRKALEEYSRRNRRFGQVSDSTTLKLKLEEKTVLTHG